ncbi:MAG: molybdopterin-guanine dinucleotide biosynthesis protein B [Gemmatimonadales bacterium]
MAALRIVSIIGRKDAGKTTLTVALAAEFVRRGRRVMTIKHASHQIQPDREGSDSWRHFNEGRAERTLLVAPDVRMLLEKASDDTDPVELARRYLGEADIVLVEGFKHASLPKIEVFRAAVADTPLYDPDAGDADDWLALLTDGPRPPARCPVLRFQDTMWLQFLANLAWDGAKVVSA